MPQNGDANPGGLFGWLVALAMTLSILPAGLLATGAQYGAGKKAPEDSGNGKTGGSTARATAAGAEPHVFHPLDAKLAEVFGLELPKPDHAVDSGKGDKVGPAQDPGPLDASLAPAIAASTTIRSMVLCIADPVASSVAFRADLQLEALQKALGAHGYVPDRWYLPWKRNSGPGKPGLIVYRKPAKKKAERHLLLVYLVGELATSGIDRQAFRAAVGHIARIEAALPPDRRSKRLPILGPVLTGSADSLGETIREGADTWWSSRSPLILNWSASAVDVERLCQLAGGGNGTLAYCETLIRQDIMWKGLADYLSSSYRPRKPRIAWLSESGTQLGTGWQLRSGQRTLYAFPMGISRVRDAYASATTGDGDGKRAVAPTDVTILRFPASDRGDAADSLPRFDAGMQAPYAELALRQILLDISRHDFDVVGITATDHRDRMFLAQQIRRYAPGSQIVFLGGDLAHEHPDYRQSLRGTIVASAYPMFPMNQRWSFRQADPLGDSQRHVFASQSGYALFNAVSCAMSLADERGRFEEDTATLVIDPARETNSSSPVPFIDYGSPQDEGSVTADQTMTPPLWISVIGDQGAWPLHTEATDDCSSRYLLKVKFQPPGIECSGANDTHDTHPFPLMFLLVLQAIAALMASWAGGVFLPLAAATPDASVLPDWARPMRTWWCKVGEPGKYDSVKARRLFMPLVIGLLALWIQVTACALLQWATFVCGLRKPATEADTVLSLFLLTGLVILAPLRLPTRIWLGIVALLCGMVLMWQTFIQHFTPLITAWLSALSAMLLLRAILAIIVRREAPNRTQPIAPYAELLLTFATVVFTTSTLLAIQHLVKPALPVPWLTTVAWIFNGVSPLLPLVTACLAIAIICRAELNRCWLIETEFVSAIGNGVDDEVEDHDLSKEKNEYSYPVSGLETAAIVRSGWHWLSSGLTRRARHSPNGERTNDRIRSIPHPYVIWIGLGLFTAWMLVLLLNSRPVYPNPWINSGLSGLIGFGYLTWAVVFAQMVALRVRFFGRLRAMWTNEVRDAASPIAKALAAGNSRETRWLGRTLYARDDAASAGGSSASWSSQRARDIKRWVAFVGAQLRIGAFGLGLGALMLFVAVSSLPFQPRSWFQLTATMSFVALGITVVSTMVRVDADEVLSLIAGTKLGQATFDWGQILKIAPWVVVPLVMVLGQTFPELWNWLGVMLDGWRTP